MLYVCPGVIVSPPLGKIIGATFDGLTNVQSVSMPHWLFPKNVEDVDVTHF
jgi:hypothetical protein